MPTLRSYDDAVCNTWLKRSQIMHDLKPGVFLQQSSMKRNKNDASIIANSSRPETSNWKSIPSGELWMRSANVPIGLKSNEFPQKPFIDQANASTKSVKNNTPNRIGENRGNTESIEYTDEKNREIPYNWHNIFITF